MVQFRSLLSIGLACNGSSLRLFHVDLMTRILQGRPELLASTAVHNLAGTPGYSV